MTDFHSISTLLNEYMAAGILSCEQKAIWEKIFEKCENTLLSDEFASLVAESRSEFLLEQAKRGGENDPTPEELKRLLNKMTVRIHLNPDMLKELMPFEVTGVIKRVTGTEKIEVRALSLLPKLILRVGYFLDEEIPQWGRYLLDESRAAWSRLGKDADELINKAVEACQDLNEFQKIPGELESWSASDLYDAGSKIYQNGSQAIFIFSTTSGLVVPAEFNPREYAPGVLKYPGRKRYFDELLNNHTELKRFYQWNRYTTAKGLYKNCEAMGKDLIKRVSINTLSRALQMPNFEITEANFGLIGENLHKIKTGLTLTFSRGVVVSERKSELKAITECKHTLSPVDKNYPIMIGRFLSLVEPKVATEWDDQFLTSNASSYSIPMVLYQLVYKKDITNIIKGWDDNPLDQQSAQSLSEEVFERLYTEGKLIVDRDISENEFVRLI